MFFNRLPAFPELRTNTPLWLYILLEAHSQSDGLTLGPMGGWIYRIGYREAIAISRKRRDAVTDPDSVTFATLEAPESVEASVLHGELIAEMDKAIFELSEPVRAAFTLRDIQGLSTKEVADVLEVSESAVKMRLARAREGLRLRLREYLV